MIMVRVAVPPGQSGQNGHAGPVRSRRAPNSSYRVGDAADSVPGGRRQGEDHSGNPGGAAPARRPRPLPRAIRGQHPSFSIFPLRSPLTRGASAPLTTCTLTQADATLPCAGQARGTEGRNRLASRRRDRGAGRVRRYPTAADQPGNGIGRRRPGSRRRPGARYSAAPHPGSPASSQSPFRSRRAAKRSRIGDRPSRHLLARACRASPSRTGAARARSRRSAGT
jgi:hypothetical protein